MINIIDRIRQHSESKPAIPALTWVNDAGTIKESLTYHELMVKVDQVSHYLQQKTNLTTGDIVALLFPPGLDFMFVFLACMQLGIIPVPLKIPTNEKNLSAILPILYDCQPKLLIGTHTIVPNKDFPFAWFNYRTPIKDAPRFNQEETYTHHLAFLQYTSGATGHPKGVMVSHQNLIHNFEVMGKNLPVTNNDILISWLPHYHDMGLIGAYLGTLYFGLSGYYMAPSSFMLNPNGFLQLVSDKKATIIQCPNSAYDWMVEQWDERDINLSSLRVIANGAEPVRLKTLEKLYQTFKDSGLRKSAMKPTYGLAEATLFVTQANTPEWVSHHGNVACGICDDIDIRIINPDTCDECKPGEEGEIWLHSMSNTLGYYNNSKLTQEIFYAKIKNANHHRHYLRTRDLGYIKDDQLYVTGRIKDIIIINGVNIYPQDIEDTVENYPGIIKHRSATFAWQQKGKTKIVVLAEVNQKKVPDIDDLTSFILKHHSIPLFDIVLCKRGSLAKTTSGKIRRQACKQLYKENNLIIIRQMMKTWGVIEFILNTYKNNHSETFYELGLDSLTMASIMSELEKYLPKKMKKKLAIQQLYQMQINEFISIVTDQTSIESQKALSAWNKRIQQIEQNLLKGISDDAKLNLTKLPTVKPYCKKTEIKNIFLTGCTGFIGAYLLLQLLKLSHFHIHLLVQAGNTNDAYERVVNNLKKYDLLPEANHYQLNERITTYCGDLSKNNFGLLDSDWQHLCDLIDSIYHNGAVTNYLASYDELKPANVDGTQFIISLALTSRLKYLHYLSTTFIFGWTPAKHVNENNHNSTFKHLDFGYAQSKWVAEQLVWQASDLGVPVQIYRPAWVTASSNAKYTEDDIIARALIYMINHQVVPSVINQISLMPVDKVASDIVNISLIENPTVHAYHLTAKYANIPQITAYITKKYGYQFTNVSLAKFNQHLQTYAKPKDVLYPLVPFFNIHYPKILKMSDKIYSRTNYLAALTNIDNPVHEYSYQEMTDFIIQFLQQKQLIASISKLNLQSFLKKHQLKERKTIAYYYQRLIRSIKMMLYLRRIR